jgi:two-component system, OmpR family, sensor histidine kinase KdpD
VIARIQARLRQVPLEAEYRLLLGLAGWVFLLVVAIVALLPFRSESHVGAIALAMLLPPLVATGSGPYPAAVAALVSGLAFNVFFTKPYNTPRIESSASVAAFVVYLVIAVTASVVVARLRESRAGAARAARDAAVLEAAASALAAAVDVEAAVRDGLVRIADAFGLRGACLLVTAEGEERFGAFAGDSATAERHARRGGGPKRQENLATFPVATPSTALGVLVTDAGRRLEPDRARGLASFAAIVGLAVERADLARERAALRAARERGRRRTRLLQDVEHDLRTPLTTIKAETAVLRTSAVAPGLDAIDAEADRLARLVEDVVDLSRVETGAIDVRPERVPVDDLVLEALAAAAGDPPAARIDVDLAVGLPALDIDPALMRRALVALLRNAGSRDPGGRIRVSAGRVADAVELRVADHGAPLHGAEREHALDPLPGHPTSVALAVARGFVVANGGTLRALPVAEGAVFSVHLPAPPAGSSVRA